MIGPVIAVLLATASPEAAAEDLSKKQAYLASKDEVETTRPARKGQDARRPIYAHYWWTKEIVLLDPPRNRSVDMDRFFRCHFTQEPTEMADELVDRIVSTARHFDVRAVKIVSGYRHPKYNLWLRKKGRQVALTSKHTEGRAIDFQLPEVEVRELYQYLLQVHPGGVGFYPYTEFVHVDTGRKRTWTGS